LNYDEEARYWCARAFNDAFLASSAGQLLCANLKDIEELGFNPPLLFLPPQF